MTGKNSPMHHLKTWRSFLLSHLPLNSSTDELDLPRRKHQRLQYFLPLCINIALAILCSERLSGGRKMNTRPNPEMTELAMMTNVPAGRTAGSAIAHCYQDGLSHMTQQEVYPRHCFRLLFFEFNISLLLLIFTQMTSSFFFLTKQTLFICRSFSIEY